MSTSKETDIVTPWMQSRPTSKSSPCGQNLMVFAGIQHFFGFSPGENWPTRHGTQRNDARFAWFVFGMFSRTLLRLCPPKPKTKGRVQQNFYSQVFVPGNLCVPPLVRPLGEVSTSRFLFWILSDSRPEVETWTCGWRAADLTVGCARRSVCPAKHS